MPLLTHPPARPSTARASALNRAVPSAHRISSKHPWHLKTDPHFGNPDYLPTCALAAHQTSPQGRMLLWALEAGADLLPPSEAMELRTALLERPTNIDALINFTETSIKNACALKNVYKSFTCIGVDKHNDPAKDERTSAGIGSILGNKNVSDVDEESSARGTPQYLLLHGSHPEQIRKRYNRLQRLRSDAVKRLNGHESNAQTVEDPTESTMPLTLRQQRLRIRAAEMALLRINKYVEQGPSYILPLYKHVSDTTKSSKRIVSAVISQHSSKEALNSAFIHNRTSLFRASVAQKQRNVLQQEAQATLLYSAITESHRRKNMKTDEKHKAHDHLISEDGVHEHHYLKPNTPPPITSQEKGHIPMPPGGTSCHWQTFLDLNGHYSVPSILMMQQSLNGTIRFKHGRKVMKNINKKIEVERKERLEAEERQKVASYNAQKATSNMDKVSPDDEDEAEVTDDDNESEKLSHDSADEADKDFNIKDYVYIPEWYDAPRPDDTLTNPTLEVLFNVDTGTLNVKFRLSDAQTRALVAQGTETTSEKNTKQAISTSPFLFQSEFVAIAADLWMGARGPWKGKMLHVARRQLRPDGTSALVEPPYLEPLGRLLDERAGLPQAVPATPPLPQCSTAIDSIMVGQWCFVKLEGRTGGRPDDPYRCTGCGNTRTSANIAYAAPSTASGLKRGKYYCPFCRRSMTHVNVALSLDPSAATRTPQWNGEPAVPLPSYKEAPLVAPLKGPMPRYINTKLHTMMGMTLI